MKKIFFLSFISGNLSFYSIDNFKKLEKSINGKLNFCFIPWKNNSQQKINHLKKIYKPIFVKKIRQPKFESITKKIKFPDNAGNSIGTLYMWESIRQSFKEIFNYYKHRKIKPDYVIRYRSDILPRGNLSLFKKRLHKNEILVPDRFHWNGINDQIFVIKYKDIKLFFDIDKFIRKFIENNRFFSSEYIFQQFLKSKKIQIRYSDFDYQILRHRGFQKLSKNINSDMKIFDKINVKLNKLSYKFRNFKKYYIHKKYLNKNQHKYI